MDNERIANDLTMFYLKLEAQDGKILADDNFGHIADEYRYVYGEILNKVTEGQS